MRDGPDAVVPAGSTARLVFQGGGGEVEVVLDREEAEQVFGPPARGFDFPPSSSASGAGVGLFFFFSGRRCRRRGVSWSVELIGGRDELLKRRRHRRAIDIHGGFRDHERDLERSRIPLLPLLCCGWWWWWSDCDLGDEVGVPACAGGFEPRCSREVGRVGAGSEGQVLEHELADL